LQIVLIRKVSRQPIDFDPMPRVLFDELKGDHLQAGFDEA